MYHGIIIDKQFTDPAFPETFMVFAKKQDGAWGIYGIEVDDAQIEATIVQIQQQTTTGKWYSHFYNDEDLIVVFREIVFRVGPDKSTWNPIIEYGRKLLIPEDQLSIRPTRFREESDYFAKENFRL